MLDLFSAASPFSLIVLVFLAILPFLANTAFWTIALRELGEVVTWRQVNRASTKTTLTRYLPGGIWLFISRSLALTHEGVAASSLVVMTGLEVLLATPVALLIGSILLSSSHELPNWLSWAALSLLLGITTLARPFLNKILRWWAKRKKIQLPPKLSSMAIFRMSISLMVYWLVFGTVFFFYLELMEQTISWTGAVGGFSLSWRISLFTPFAPQGLGLFEPSFIALLGWSADALLLIGAFRIVLIIRDLLLTVGAGMIFKKRPELLKS